MKTGEPRARVKPVAEERRQSSTKFRRARSAREAQSCSAPPEKKDRGSRRARGSSEIPRDTAPTVTSDPLSTAQRARQYLALQRARVAFGNQLAAIGRRLLADASPAEAQMLKLLYVDPLDNLLDPTTAREDAIARDVRKEMERDPFGAFCLPRHKGLGALGLAQILAAFGDLDRYQKPSAMWKQMGGQVVNGRSPRRERGVAWGLHDVRSFSPLAKTTMFRLADSAVKGENAYREIYQKERARILAKPRTGPSQCPLGKVHEHHEREANQAGEQRKTGASKMVTCVHEVEGREVSAHVHAHCLRIVAKEMLLDVWLDWREWRHGEKPDPSKPRRIDRMA